MIWGIMGILVLAVLLFLTKPLYAKTAPKAVQDSEVAAYQDQIALLDAQIKNGGDVSTLETAKTELQRGLLASKGKPLSADKGPFTKLVVALFLGGVLATAGLYSMLGRPELTVAAGFLPVPQSTPQGLKNVSAGSSLEELVVQLEEKLKTTGNTPEGWMIYARSLIRLGRYDEALSAYDKVLKLTDNHADVLAEKAEAEAYIAGRETGPNQEQIESAGSMSAEDRAAMIENMVEGLSQKLRENPQDVDGWTRLLRARLVLEQTELGAVDVDFMRGIYSQSPENIDKILSDSGWGEQGK